MFIMLIISTIRIGVLFVQPYIYTLLFSFFYFRIGSFSVPVLEEPQTLRHHQTGVKK
jgi:hypothetical protein